MSGSLRILPLPAPPSDRNLGSLPPSQVQDDYEDENMQEVEDDQNRVNSAPVASVATHTRTIGIIHPPPYIRNIVDKTAAFVAKNGVEFEIKIIANNVGNPKFNFLNGSDPYHAYYQHRRSEICAQNQFGTQQPIDGSDTVSALSAPAADYNDHSAQFRPVCKVLEPPETEQYTVRLPEGITGEALDLIKLTAQFVAQNGIQFLTGLTTRENSNPQFHFLKPTHSIFMFFTSLTDAYSKVLMPPKDLTDKLGKSVTDMTTVLERCLDRLEWERSQEQAKQKAEDEIEQERLQMAMIDWHDFVVVETIDFADDEDEEEVQLVEECMENGEDGKNESKITPEEQEAPMRIVRNWKRPEDRIPAERDPTMYVVSSITGELIHIHEISEHVRISLIDPKYMEQKERMFAKLRETTLAQDDEISRNIVGLAQTRPDIFGTTEEEVSNAVKAEIEKKNERTSTQSMTQNVNGEDQKDGVNSGNLVGHVAPPLQPGMPSLRPLPLPTGLALNLPRVPPNTVQYFPVTSGGLVPRPSISTMVSPLCPPPPMQISYGQQSYMMNRPPPPMPPSISVNPPSISVPPPNGSQFTPLAPRFPMPQHGMPMVPPPPMPLGMPPPPPPEEVLPPLPEEPEPKRQRLDDSLLIPEDQFFARHPGPARVAVSVPNMDEGNLKGQVLEITVQSLSETVGCLKEKIAGEIQLPGNKQKLSGKAGFLKDNLSLAYYNIAAGASLTLSLRERGGRKR